ncbi:serine/threonine-protein kinase [Streptomyces sp. NPDC051452]|uniref:serine/threonine-protein kinase n=1 Tax=Streptomyces sp. NPDC051452 TaxID=3365654 RepID=UPI0037937E66
MEKRGPGDQAGFLPGGADGRVGGYRLLARLGAGGMGNVYLARSDRGRTAAVKVVREELAAREEFRARFRQEVRAARRVGGYWTAPVLDADTEAPVPWVATGYVAGPSLQQVVGHDHGALPERSVRILAAGLALALKDIHAAGIVHRDLKPSNVLITIDGPRVIDFGIARALEETSPGGEGLTRTGSLVGSPGFMAPEQVRGDRITPACDVFCLGSVLTYAATGSLPFGPADSGVHALMFRIAQEEPDLSGVPEGIADLVRDCLRKDPGARPTLDVILERTGADDTVSGGRSRDPWLPGSLVAQLGRHAVRLLEAEDPEGPDGPEGSEDSESSEGPADPRGPGASAGGAADPLGDGASEHGAVGDGGFPPSVPASASPVMAGAYGHPRQHPRQAGYGWGVDGALGATAPYGPKAGAGDEPERRDGRSTALLIVIALVVALGAGGTVYALMKNGVTGDQGTGPAGTAPATAPASPPPTGAKSGAPGPVETSPSPGAVPAAYLGSWRTTVDDAGSDTRELTIRQGEVGDPVLKLVADGPTGGGGTYHCVFEAELTERPAAGGPLEFGPSTVTAGGPASACSPGAATEVTLLPGGRLKRAKRGGAESLTYGRW